MLSLQELTFQYRRQAPVFSGLNLHLPAGRSVGILGANGVGKSTLLKLVTGLLAPSAGKINALGFTPRDRNPELFGQLYFIPEMADLPPMKGSAYVREFGVFYPNFDAEQAHSLAEAFAVPMDRSLQTLSLGQKKKFMVAFALATNAKLIVMDEPTNGLDIPAKSLFREQVIRSLSDEQTLLISTHQVRDLDTLIDSVVLMNTTDVRFVDLSLVPDALSIQRGPLEEDQHAIYQETRLGALHSLVKQPDPRGAEMDLEILFNAFHSAPNELLEALASQEVAS